MHTMSENKIPLYLVDPEMVSCSTSELVDWIRDPMLWTESCWWVKTGKTKESCTGELRRRGICIKSIEILQRKEERAVFADLLFASKVKGLLDL